MNVQRYKYFPEVFDSSMLAAFKSCPQLFKKIYLHEWKPREGANVNLIAGGAFAKGIEEARRSFYEKGTDQPTALAAGLQALTIAYGDFECPPDSPKSLERMLGALEYYITNYPFTHQTAYPILLASQKRAIEANGAEPLPILHPLTQQPLLYSWRADAILAYSGSQYVTDEKTTTQLGSLWGRRWDLRSQFIGYTNYARKIVPVAGVLVRGIAIKKTMYEVQEAICNFSQNECDRWYVELLKWISDIIRCWETDSWRYNFDHACEEYGGCAFKTVCKAEADMDATPILQTFFQKRHWDPITRTETNLETGEIVRQA